MSTETNVNPQEVSQYGQTDEHYTQLMAVFGWLIDYDKHHITDLTDRSIDLLIEEYRWRYGKLN